MHDSGNRVLKSLFILVWVIAIIHIAAEQHYWYWSYRWLDVPMHLFGGVWLGLMVLWFRNHTRYLRSLWMHLSSHNLTVALLGGVCIGLVWEAYEYSVWSSVGYGFPPNYGADTQLDLVMDTLGAAIGYLAYRLLAPRTMSAVTQ